MSDMSDECLGHLFAAQTAIAAAAAAENLSNNDLYVDDNSTYVDGENSSPLLPPPSSTIDWNALAACNLTSFFTALVGGGVDGGSGGGGLIPDGAEFDVIKNPAFAAPVIVVYVAVIVLGALGNALVFVTVATTPRMRNATNIFIANLALADIFVCVFDLPLNLYYQLSDDWAYGRALCHVIPAAFAVVVYASTLTLAMIAVDRFRLIVLPTRRRISPLRAIVLLVVIAVLSAAVAVPIAVYGDYVVLDDPTLNLNRRYCTEKWPSRRTRKVYTVLTFAVQFFLPLVVIVVLYLLVFRRVHVSRKQSKGCGGGAGGRAGENRKSKMNRMLVGVVAVFAVAWTPYQLYSVMSEFQPGLVSGRYYKFVDLMLRVTAMSSSCVNPFLYGWLNDNFRKAFLGIIRRGGGGGGTGGGRGKGGGRVTSAVAGVSVTHGGEGGADDDGCEHQKFQQSALQAEMTSMGGEEKPLQDDQIAPATSPLELT